jgi:hypothetical protein
MKKLVFAIMDGIEAANVKSDNRRIKKEVGPNYMAIDIVFGSLVSTYTYHGPEIFGRRLEIKRTSVDYRRVPMGCGYSCPAQPHSQKKRFIFE